MDGGDHILSPLDGRYKEIVRPITSYFSETSLIKKRIFVEVSYLLFLSKTHCIRAFTKKEFTYLSGLARVSANEVSEVKQIEQKTHHDVKAIEYFIQNKIQKTTLVDIVPYIHIGLTSEDINNLSYRLMVQNALRGGILPIHNELLSILLSLVDIYKKTPMLARTHGQPAIPTTFGKELGVFSVRLVRVMKKIRSIEFTGKVSGAVGTYGAHTIAFPGKDWIALSQKFVSDLGLVPNIYSTQINPPDDLIELFSSFHLLQTILVGFTQDMWRYISDDWLVQKGKKQYVGSSTMPHKVNPIEFENSEGNLLLSNALLELFLRKLPISRLQRDLSDSTVLRNIGVSFGYGYVAVVNLIKGLSLVEANKEKMLEALNENWNILSEAMQMEARISGNTTAYEEVAQVTRQSHINKAMWVEMTKNYSKSIQELTPETYMGESVRIAKLAKKEIQALLKQKI